MSDENKQSPRTLDENYNEEGEDEDDEDCEGKKCQLCDRPAIYTCAICKKAFYCSEEHYDQDS